MLHLNIIKVKTPEEMGKAAADEFEAVICRKPACVMGLATGSTPLPLYRELIAREQAGKLDFSRVRSANLDEYKGLAPDHPQSYRRFMQENLFDHISIKPENTIVPDGLAADGADIAYVDIAVQDSAGRVCPLCDARIDFTLDGPAQFLGGYNSGRFAGYGHDDSVIHQNHVYAECGTNRVFLRAGTAPGTIRLTAVMGSIRNVITLQSKPADLSPLTAAPLPCRLPDYAACAPQHRDAFVPIPQADAAKYQPEDKCYTKILVNGQEPDTRGVRSVNENGRVWGAVLCILERLQTVIPDAFRYDWNAAGGCLTLHSGGHTVTAQVGVTHLLVDGKENLMDGQPYLTAEGALVMEVNALIPHITGTCTQYDDKVNVLRIETE